MRRIAFPAVLLAAISVAHAQTPPPKSVAPHVPAEWKAGTASVVVTPEKNLWMAGYAARKQPAEGKVHDLYAKALALEDAEGTRAVIVTMDLIGVPQILGHAVASRAEKELRLPPANLSPACGC